jgi:hypothetical protein
VTCQLLRIDGGCVFVFVVFQGQGEQQPGQVLATIDQSDIRGSKPHNLDPSGAASD